MFTGIIKKVCSISELISKDNLLSFAVELGDEFTLGLEIGASISVEGVCLTVVKIDQSKVWFDAIEETLSRTTLKTLCKGERVNIERAMRMGEEIGGHLLSGHIYGTAQIHEVVQTANHWILTLHCPSALTKYLFPKGYIALNGASLTLVDVWSDQALFTVHLIPETLRKTTFKNRSKGDFVNLELDSQTQAIVDTVERFLEKKYQTQISSS
jgi:riboflavin synthase